MTLTTSGTSMGGSGFVFPCNSYVIGREGKIHFAYISTTLVEKEKGG